MWHAGTVDGGTVFDILTRGPWILSRTIDLRHSGQRAEVTGRARWGRDPGDPTALGYREEATLTVAGASLPSSRSLLFRALDGPATAPAASIHFADGRFFYLLSLTELTGGGAEVVHDCGADRYRGLVHLDPHGRFHERWIVHGPAKDYTSTTLLTPSSP